MPPACRWRRAACVTTALALAGAAASGAVVEEGRLPLWEVGPEQYGAHPRNWDFAFSDAGLLAVANTHGVLLYGSRLEGVDREWSPWSTESFRDDTALPGGRLRFVVRARDVLGPIGTSRALPLSVAWPWYATSLARVGWTVLALLAVLVLSWAAALWRSRALESRASALEEQVRERTRRLESQTRRLEAQARTIAEQEAAKSRFFANLTHELRTPLTLTIGPLEDVERGLHGELRDDARGQIQLALRHNRRLLRLLEQLLDVARADAGALRLRPRTGDLAPFVREIAELFRSRAESKGIELAVEVPRDPLETTFDSDQIEKVLFNLLSNALKFTPPGGRVGVGLGTDSAGDRVIEIRDTGPGIAPEDRSRIFERYYQGTVGLDATHPGVGLGLAFSREIVEAHGGRLEVESEPGAGTVFRLVLAEGCEQFTNEQLRSGGRLERPSSGFGATLMARLETDTEQHGAPPAEPGDLLPQDTPTVLVVDDHDEMRRHVRKHLEDGYRVLEAGNGAAALEIARGEIPDLILSDVMMPDMNGLELCREIRADPEIDFVPVILLTARSTPADAVEGLHRGADDYVVKPFDAEELRARVDGLIASRRHLQARFASAEPVRISGLAAADREFVERLYSVLEERLDDERLDVPALARALAMERSTLYRRCQRVLELTPTEVVRSYRLDRAATLLREGAGTVSEVAYAVGFASLSYFSKTFRERFGTSPSEYRAVQNPQPAAGDSVRSYESPP